MDWVGANREAWTLLGAGQVRCAVALWVEVGEALRRRGALDLARGIARTLVQVSEAGDSRLQRVAWYAMAESARELGEFEEAERWIRKALKEHQSLGDARGVASDLISLGELAEERGELAEAVALWQQALDRLDPEPSGEAAYETHLALARGYTGLGEDRKAQEHTELAERLAERWAA